MLNYFFNLSSTVCLTNKDLEEEVVNATPRPLYTRERDTVHIAQEVGWVSVLVWTVAKKILPSTGIRSLTVKPVASRYNN